MKVALDVQHLYRPPPHDADRGAVFQLSNGLHVAETDLAAAYAAAIARTLSDNGATVFTNNPLQGLLVGSYRARQLQADRLGVDLYLALHVNAGGGRYGVLEYLSWGKDGRAADAIASALRPLYTVYARGGWVEERILRPGHRGVVCLSGVRRAVAVLIEPFFGDGPNANAFMSPSGLNGLGEAIARGVLSWGESL